MREAQRLLAKLGECALLDRGDVYLWRADVTLRGAYIMEYIRLAAARESNG